MKVSEFYKTAESALKSLEYEKAAKSYLKAAELAEELYIMDIAASLREKGTFSQQIPEFSKERERIVQEARNALRNEDFHTAYTLYKKANIPIKITAKIKLDTGPARATMAISLRGSLKLRQSTGTGLAQPKKTPPVNRATPGKITVPKISRWAIGLIVNLPSSFAVGSPFRLATQAWANS